MLPVARGANGQPPIPPTDASSASLRPRSRRARSRRPVLRVLCRWTPTGIPSGATRATRRRTWRGTPTPTVSARTISSGRLGDTALASRSTRPGRRALERAAEGDADVTVARMPSACARATIRSPRLDANRQRRALVALVERLSGGEGEVHRVELGRGQAVIAALVQHEARRRRRRGGARSRRRPPRRPPSAAPAPG